MSWDWRGILSVQTTCTANHFRVFGSFEPKSDSRSLLQVQHGCDRLCTMGNTLWFWWTSHLQLGIAWNQGWIVGLAQSFPFKSRIGTASTLLPWTRMCDPVHLSLAEGRKLPICGAPAELSRSIGQQSPAHWLYRSQNANSAMINSYLWNRVSHCESLWITSPLWPSVSRASTHDILESKWFSSFIFNLMWKKTTRSKPCCLLFPLVPAALKRRRKPAKLRNQPPTSGCRRRPGIPMAATVRSEGKNGGTVPQVLLKLEEAPRGRIYCIY